MKEVEGMDLLNTLHRLQKEKAIAFKGPGPIQESVRAFRCLDEECAKEVVELLRMGSP